MSKQVFDVLKNVTSKIGSGATPTGGQTAYKSEGISLIRSQNVLDFSFSKNGLAFIDEEQAAKLESVTLHRDDILLNITGDSIARVCKVPNDILPARVNQHVSIIRANQKIDSDYLMYYLLFRKEYLLTISRVGGTRNALTKEAIENIAIRIDENDKKIASVLSALDDKIELNYKINAELEAMAKTLYDYWFVQFEFPVVSSSLATTSHPEALEGYKSSGGKMVYNDVLKREIPKGWEVKKLDELLIQFTKGITTSYVEKSELINLNQKVNKGSFLERQYFKYLDESVEIPESKFAKKGDILINSLGQGTLGRVHYFIDPENNIVVDQHLFILRTNYKKITSSYLYSTLSSKAYQFQIERQITGSTGMQMLNASNLKDLPILTPDLRVCNEFENLFSKFYDRISVNEKQNQELSSLRDWLLPMLMNGQVKVEEVEEQVLGMVAESNVLYNKSSQKNADELFEIWLLEEGLAARGDIDKATLRELFDAMDDEDKY